MPRVVALLMIVDVPSALLMLKNVLFAPSAPKSVCVVGTQASALKALVVAVLMSVVTPVVGSMLKNIFELGFEPYRICPAQTRSAALLSATAMATRKIGRMTPLKA